MARIISLINHKGGVGKTTTTLNLGKALSLLGKKVLVVDIDPQASLSICLGVRDPKKNIYHSLCEDEVLPILKIDDNFYLVPSDLNLVKAEVKLQSTVNGYYKLNKLLSSQVKNYDYILIDCPPSLGLLTHNALISSNEYLIIVQSQFMSLEGLSTIQEVIKGLTEKLNQKWKLTGLLLTQTNHTVSSKTVVEDLIETYGKLVFKTQIRQNVALIETSAAKTDIFNYNPNSTGAEDYMNLAKEINDK